MKMTTTALMRTRANTCLYGSSYCQSNRAACNLRSYILRPPQGTNKRWEPRDAVPLYDKK